MREALSCFSPSHYLSLFLLLLPSLPLFLYEPDALARRQARRRSHHDPRCIAELFHEQHQHQQQTSAVLPAGAGFAADIVDLVALVPKAVSALPAALSPSLFSPQAAAARPLLRITQGGG